MATTTSGSEETDSPPETTDHGEFTTTEAEIETSLITSMGGSDLCEEAPLDAAGVDRACQSADECVVVFHQTDCCGTLAAFAVHVDSQAAYDDAEAPCMFEPNCDCAPQATAAEDGEATADNASIVAACVDNVCRSEVPGP